MITLTAFLMLLMQFFGSTLISFFVSKEDDIAPQVIELGAKGLKITSLFYLSLGLIYVVRGVLTGLGDAFFALFNGIIEVIGRFTIPFLITSYLGYGEAGIWLASGFVWLLSGVTAWIRYKAYFRSKVSLPSREIKIHVPAKHKIHKGSFRLLPQKFHH